MLGFQKIVCPTDYSAASDAALETAVDLSFHFGAELILLHVADTFPVLGSQVPELGMVPVDYATDNNATRAVAEQRLHQTLHERVPDYLLARAEVRCGDPVSEIVQAAHDEQADLIVMCTHGQTGWRHLVFGSVAEKVVQLAPCHVLVTRARAERVFHDQPLAATRTAATSGFVAAS